VHDRTANLQAKALAKHLPASDKLRAKQAIAARQRALMAHKQALLARKQPAASPVHSPAVRAAAPMPDRVAIATGDEMAVQKMPAKRGIRGMIVHAAAKIKQKLVSIRHHEQY
jgi:hypothetical protein